MKRKFLSIAMVALMLLTGTNVYLANQQNQLENNINLENLEASADPIVEIIVAVVGGCVVWGISSAYDYYNEPGPMYIEYVKEQTTIGKDIIQYFEWFCYSAEGAHDSCIPVSSGVGSRIITCK